MESFWEGSFREFLQGDQCRNLILNEAFRLKESEAVNIISITFNGCCLSSEVPSLLIALFKKPAPTLRRCHHVLTEVGRKVLDENKMVVAPNLVFRFRLETLQPMDKAILLTVPKEENVGNIVEFKGTVVKATQPKMIEKLKRYTCSSCKIEFKVWADITQNNQCPPPTRCPNSGSCQGGNMKEIQANPLLDSKDYQEIKVQEKVGKSVVGKIPRSVWVIMDEDLVDSCKAGDDVVVIGEVTRRWGYLGGGKNKRTDIEYVLLANSVQVNNYQKSFRSLSKDQTAEIEEFWNRYRFSEVEGRNKLLAAFCPQVYGLFCIKLAVSVVLCGGIERVDQTGTKIRGEPHLLLVGDPGTGKSQVLRYAAKIVPRSVMTTGIGSTGAGLTASAARDGGQWHLEAGALVMADGGICCIDEFNSIRESDRVAIHEAMEQQSISVAKAGLVCQLRTRCSVLACVNPKGKYDPEEPVTVNVGIASPLLSRFDLIFLLLDSKNPSWDKKVSDYILEGKDPILEMSKKGSVELLWNFSMMQSYFSFCKQFNPTISTSASRILTRYYQKRRACANENIARSTVRLLQSAIRLSEAHARFMCHDEVTVFDAVSVVYLLETSMDSNGSLIAAANPLHTSFPDNPSIQYLKEAEAILTGLGLQEIWQDERKKVIENRGRKVLQLPESFTQALIANQTFVKPNPPQIPRSIVSHEISELSVCDVTSEELFDEVTMPTKSEEKVTKLKRKHGSPHRPETVLSKTSSIIFSKDEDLEDLDDFQLSKKFKIQGNVTFPIIEDNPMTSTQIEPTHSDSNGITDVRRNVKNLTEVASIRTPPGLSAKTLSKLHMFSAPKFDDEDLEEAHNNPNESKHLEVKSFGICLENSKKDDVSLTGMKFKRDVSKEQGKSLRELFGQNLDDDNLDGLDDF